MSVVREAVEELRSVKEHCIGMVRVALVLPLYAHSLPLT